MSTKIPKLSTRPSAKAPNSSRGGLQASKKDEIPTEIRVQNNLDEFLTRKVEAEHSCRGLEESIKLLEQKIPSIIEMQEAEEIAFKEKIQKTLLLEAKGLLCQNQADICKELVNQAAKINQKLSCKLSDEVSSPEQSLVFNHNTKQLESSLKSLLRRCLVSTESSVSSQAIKDMVKNFSCQERLQYIQEIQDEVKNEVSNYVDSIDLERDAQKLSEELEKLEIGKVALVPLENHIKDFAIKQARAVLDEQDLIHENNKLERQLQELLLNNPDMASDAKAVLDVEQTEILQKHLNALSLENHEFSHIESEQEQMLKKIISLHKKLEELRYSVMKDLSSMESISTHQQKLVDDMHEIDKSCTEFGKMLDIEKHNLALIKILCSTPMSLTKINTQSEPVTADLAGAKAMLRQLEMQQKHEKLCLQEQSEAFTTLKINMGIHRETLKREAAVVQKNVCEAQNLYLDHASAPKEFNEKLQNWKENAVEKMLAEDTTRSVNDLALQEWIDLFTESFPEINCLSEGLVHNP
ncbi:uncharacterized protein LOC132205498 isoform X2 [Neocloeon triangulifer]|uniref:uncharacterized protein LOC132205498 isoform X2 n=1 Tax=Neocloeon triangulifer TaxID=2078957 RepID=UPI00286EBB2F|nr:uncharacterized protein LOC132205498 isoform X2 [Neocloeon triangulifer]